jgi:hypothetical protein
LICFGGNIREFLCEIFMLNYNRPLDDKLSATEFVTFNRVTNIIDLGAASGVCAETFQEVFGPDTKAATMAWDFRDSVKHQIILKDTGPITEADVRGRSSQDWDAIHVHFLTNAEDVFYQLKLVAADRKGSDLIETLEAFKTKIEAGRRLEIALV